MLTRNLVVAGLCCCHLFYAQKPAPAWRPSLASLPPTPPARTTPQDVQQFEKNMRLAAAYLGNTTPTANTAQWEANRELVRHMSAYLYGLQALSSDPNLRGAVTHAQQSFDSLGLAPYLVFALAAPAPYPDAAPNSPGQPLQEVSQAQPSFALNAPDLTGLSDADKSAAGELCTRYENDAAAAAAVWGNAEILRQNLEARGMGLNLETATALVRLPGQFRSSATALRNHDWDGARVHLEQAEAITAKIAKTVGS